ncbi:MAG: NERD domain-containing protein [Bacilli bacterium]|nr:NERD domain-containing protein [Bacilli bacterium]MDY6392690.1 nuclease-related domain-containing protein [Bacilli bacterium]
MPYNVELTLFIVLASVAGLAFLFWFLYGPIKRFLYAHYTVRMYYKRVYRVALDNDFYLINEFTNRTAELEEFHIDHILIGNKFFYCIRDRYYDGAIAAKEDNPSWIFFHKEKGEYITNPMELNKLRVQRLSLMSGIDEKLFVSIVLINDDCFLTPFQPKSGNSFLSSLKDFPKLIEELEAREEDPLNPWDIAVAARDFSEFNRRDEKK